MKVKNNLANRQAAVRTGFKEGDKLVKIPPGQTVDVPGFDVNDEFHAGLIDRGDISVGNEAGRVTRASADAAKGAELQADLETKQRAVTEAETAYTAAKTADDSNSSPETKQAKKAAGDAVRTARTELAAAEKAFAAG